MIENALFVYTLVFFEKYIGAKNTYRPHLTVDPKVIDGVMETG